MDQSPHPIRKGERTAQRILDAAEAIFAEKGYAGATLRDVATAVGIRTPSLYNHFPSKESLYAAVLERGLSPILELLAEFAEFANPPAATAEPRELIERVMKFLADSPNLPRLILHETLAGGERLTPELRAWIGPIFAQANQMAEETSDRSHEQIPLLVLALYNIVVGYFAIAPLYRELNGKDLMSESLRLQQIEIIADLAQALFPRSQPTKPIG